MTRTMLRIPAPQALAQPLSAGCGRATRFSSACGKPLLLAAFVALPGLGLAQPASATAASSAAGGGGATATLRAAPPRAKLMVNVRVSPDLQSRIVGVMQAGDPAEILAEQGEFVRLKTRTGKVGYLRHRNLSGYRAAAVAAAPLSAAQPPVVRTPEAPVLAYKSPYPAPPLRGNTAVAVRSGANPPPITPLSASQPALWQLSVGAGVTLSTQSSRELKQALRKQGFDGQIVDSNQAAPGGFIRASYGLGSPLRLEAALIYLGDFDLRLSSVESTAGEVQRIADEHAVATGLGLAPTLAYQWTDFGRALTLRAGGFIGLGEGHDLTLNGRRVELDDAQDGALAGLSWESRHPAGVWTGLDAQVMYLNDWVGLVALTARWGD